MPTVFEIFFADNTYSMLTQKITLRTSYFLTHYGHMGLLYQRSTKEFPYKMDHEVMPLKYFAFFPQFWKHLSQDHQLH